jgi:hypothetical protein
VVWAIIVRPPAVKNGLLMPLVSVRTESNARKKSQDVES